MRGGQINLPGRASGLSDRFGDCFPLAALGVAPLAALGVAPLAALGVAPLAALGAGIRNIRSFAYRSKTIGDTR
jgi:hypothetical protein